MRVLVVSNMFPTEEAPHGGIFVTQRLRAHAKLGHEIDAIALRPSMVIMGRERRGAPTTTGQHTENHLLDFTYELSLPDRVFARIRYPRKQLMNAVADAIINRTREGKYDAIHAHGMYRIPAGGVAARAAEKLQVPYVVSVHGSDIHALMPTRRGSYANVLNQAGAVAFVSQAVQARARELGCRNAAEFVIPNGVDPEVFTPQRGYRDLGNRPVVAFVGNLLSVKGADFLPEIFGMVLQRFSSASLVIAGDGPLRSQLERIMANLPVTFLGAVGAQKVADVMAAADVLLLPSRNEGWPCVVLEAHACETPVVGADAGGTAEAIGDPYFVVSHGTEFPQRFAKRVVEVLSARAPSRSLRARALDYTWERIAQHEYDMLERTALSWDG